VANSRDTTAISDLTGQPVSTWSEEWRIETEARAVVAMPEQERDVFFNGRRDEDGEAVGRSVIGTRGIQAAKDLRRYIMQRQKAQSE
jgi:hypothetical protein